MTAYLDASVLVPLVVQEPSSPTVRAWFAAQSAEGAASSRWATVESASAIGNRVRRGDLTPAQGRQALDALERDLMPELDLADVAPADFDFARRAIGRFDLGLRAGDALHVAVALRIDALVLVSLDRRLANAARAFSLDAAEPS